MKIQIMVDAGAPQQTRGTPEPEMSIESQVRGLIDLIDSGHDSNVEWRALKKFYTVLRAAKQTEQVKNLRNMIEPVLSKLGYPVGRGTLHAKSGEGK